MSDLSDVGDRMRRAREAEPGSRRVELRRMAAAGRRVIERMVASEAPPEVIRAAAEQMETIAAALEEYPNGRLAASFGGGPHGPEFAETANAGDPHAFFDHSPLIGLANPLAPPLQLTATDEEVVGEARFGSAYEGPPGHVHGGYIAAAFDEVLGMTQSLTGRPGMTGRLTVHYRSPTPLHADLRFAGRLERVDGRKIFTRGELRHGETLCAEAEGLFISVDFAAFARRVAEAQGAPDPSG